MLFHVVAPLLSGIHDARQTPPSRKTSVAEPSGETVVDCGTGADVEVEDEEVLSLGRLKYRADA